MEGKQVIPEGPALGCWKLGGDAYWPAQTHTDSLKVIDAAIRGGIHHIDTAQVYGNGRSEQLLGQRLRRVDPPPIIATKILPCPPDILEKKINRSLKRLGREKIDILYIHWPAGEKDLRPLMEALEAQRTRGRIGLIGVSNFPVHEMEEISQAGRIDICQVGHSLLWRLPELRIIPWCREQQIPVAAYAPLAQGLLARPEQLLPWLSDNTAPPFQESDRRNDLLLLKKELRPGLSAFFETFRRLTDHREEGKEHQKPVLSPAQWSLLWSFTRPFLHSVIIGAGRRKHLEEALEAWKSRDCINEQMYPGGMAETLLDLEAASAAFLHFLKERPEMADWENIFGHRPENNQARGAS